MQGDDICLLAKGICVNDRHVSFSAALARNDTAAERLRDFSNLFADVAIANNGIQGVEMFCAANPNIIILDIMLPYMNGYDVLSALRKDKIKSAILLLTAKDAISDKVKGLDLGADDYMTKPFSMDELLARVRMLSRRRGEVVIDSLEYGDIVFNISTSELSCKDSGKSVRLIYKEAKLLEMLLSKPQIIISKDEIYRVTTFIHIKKYALINYNALPFLSYP